MIAPISADAGECLIRVQAQVMAWDEKFSGWVPLEDGGVSAVSLMQKIRWGPGKKPRESRGSVSEGPSPRPTNGFATRHEYTIHSCHLVDKRILLNCTLTKDTNYRQVMPTFHHWQIGEDKFGLKFMSSYEACRFHNKLQKAVEHLRRQSKSSSGESNVETNSELEDDVFVPVTLPVNGNNNQQREAFARFRPPPALPAARASPVYAPAEVGAVVPSPSLESSSTPGAGPSTTGTPRYVPFVRQPPRLPLAFPSTIPMGVEESIEELELETIGIEAIYEKRASIASVKIPGLLPLVPLKRPPPKKRVGSVSAGSMTQIGRREQCRHCRQFYYVRDNQRGACPGAPDPWRRWIRRLTCLCLADRLLTTFCPEPRSRRMRQRQRWWVLGALALLSPCLWCYPLLAGCARCCRLCGCRDGRHQPEGGTTPVFARRGPFSSK